MNKKKILYTTVLVLGIVLVLVELLVVHDKGHKTLSGILIGVGAGLFGMGAGELVSILIMEKHPEAKRKADIEAKDERNRHINDMARSKAFVVMETLYAILALMLILMGEPLLTILLVIGGYLVGWSVYIGYLFKYQKEM